MRQAAQQFALRPAALKAPAPQPGLVRGQQRQPPLPNTAELQQRAAIHPLHHRVAARWHHLHHPHPAAPAWVHPVNPLPLQPFGHRVAPSHLADPGQKPLFQHPPGRGGGQNITQWRAIQALGTGKSRAGGNKHRPASLDIIGNIPDINLRQHPLAAETVKDNQVKIGDLFGKQFLRRKGDQRHLLIGHPVLLFGRTQDGEMHKVHRGIRLQQVAPGALPGIWLAGNQQHPQPVPHPVDAENRAIVQPGQLACHLRRADLKQVYAGVVDAQVQRHIGVERQVDHLLVAAVNRGNHPRHAR